MKIRQLQYVSEIGRRDFNVSTAASCLHTSQPGVSKQVRLLEKELGGQIFVREGRRLVGLTPHGQEIIGSIRRIVADAAYICSVFRERSAAPSATLTVATTHGQARYALTEVIKCYGARHPHVKITLRQASPPQIVDLVYHGEADLGITTDPPKSPGVTALRCHDIGRVVVVPSGHPLARAQSITLKSLSVYPLITYEAAFQGRQKILKAFEDAGLSPSIVLSVSDADVMKMCIEHGIGIGVLFAIAYDPERDKGLSAIPAEHLFPPAKVSVVLNHNRQPRMHEFDFVEEFCKRWTRARVQAAMAKRTDASIPFDQKDASLSQSRHEPGGPAGRRR